MDKPSRSLSALRDFLERHLLESVVPFWERHALDEAGGINTCIADDGTLVNRDKWLWSQWRAVWVFSELYRRFGRHERWLTMARNIYKFARQHGWDEGAGGWVLRLSWDGKVLAGCESIYADAFAIYGCVALARATGEREPLELARRSADACLRRLALGHDKVPHFPYPVPAGARVHGLPMMFSHVLWELGEALGDKGYRRAAVAMSDDIFANFYRPRRDLILERIAADNRELPAPLGTAVVPGHVVEDMWFQIHIAKDRRDSARMAQAVRLIRRHMEFGWDAEYGGLFLAVDAEGADTVGWNFADLKLWWPHTEALYALLLAYEHSGQPWCLEWYDKVHEYSFAHYPVAEHGEWRQKLTRDGRPFTGTVALPVKDPFHLPRALMYCVEVLGRLITAPGSPGTR